MHITYLYLLGHIYYYYYQRTWKYVWLDLIIPSEDEKWNFYKNRIVFGTLILEDEAHCLPGYCRLEK